MNVLRGDRPDGDVAGTGEQAFLDDAAAVHDADAKQAALAAPRTDSG